MSSRMNLNTLGAAFVDYHLENVGAAAFQLAHDWFIKQDLVIRDAPAGGGNLLREGVDYTLATESLDETGAGYTIPGLSTRVTAAVGAGRNVYHYIAVINVAYQAGDLYFSGKYVGDSVEQIDHEARLVVAITGADHTILDDDDTGVLEVDPDGADRTVTLPTVADNLHRELVIVNTADIDTLFLVSVDGEGAEVVRSGGRDFAIVDLLPGMVLRIKSDGVKWVKISPPAWWSVFDPGVGNLASKAAGWTADRFTAVSGGMEVDFSGDLPRGALAVKAGIGLATTTGAVYARAEGDPNIANTPIASTEYSCWVFGLLGKSSFTCRLSAAYKIELAVTDTGTDVDVSHASEFLW